MKVLLVDALGKHYYTKERTDIFYCFNAVNPPTYAINNPHYIPGNYIDIIEKHTREGEPFAYVVIAPNSNCECVYDCGKNQLLVEHVKETAITHFYGEIFTYMAQKEIEDFNASLLEILDHIE